jgi:hypothetical protein
MSENPVTDALGTVASIAATLVVIYTVDYVLKAGWKQGLALKTNVISKVKS